MLRVSAKLPVILSIVVYLCTISGRLYMDGVSVGRLYQIGSILDCIM